MYLCHPEAIWVTILPINICRKGAYKGFRGAEKRVEKILKPIDRKLFSIMAF